MRSERERLPGNERTWEMLCSEHARCFWLIAPCQAQSLLPLCDIFSGSWLLQCQCLRRILVEQQRLVIGARQAGRIWLLMAWGCRGNPLSSAMWQSYEPQALFSPKREKGNVYWRSRPSEAGGEKIFCQLGRQQRRATCKMTLGYWSLARVLNLGCGNRTTWRAFMILMSRASLVTSASLG